MSDAARRDEHEGSSSAQGGPAKSDHADLGPAESDPANSDPAQSDPANSGPAESDPANSGPVESDSAELGPAKSDPAEPGLAELAPVDLDAAFERIPEYWSPRYLAELNGQQVRAARLLGEFIWHHHEHEDELFLVLEGELEIHLRDRVVTIAAGQLFVVPRGVEHKPVAHVETRVLLFEPAATLHTGNVRHERTVDRIQPL